MNLEAARAELARIWDELVDLTTPGAVAGFLTAGGHRGVPYNPCRCPIAMLVAARLGIPPNQVHVQNQLVKIYDTATSDEPVVEYGLPVVATEFIHVFDEGGFPDLNVQLDGASS